MSFPPILSLIYAEFDTTQGPVLKHCIPPNPIVFQEFDSLVDFIIPKPSLCDQFLSISNNLHILGHPICIFSDQYDRNVKIFNLCFCFDKRYTDVRCYEKIVDKVARVLRNAEIQGIKVDIVGMMKRIVAELNRMGESCIPIDSVNVLNLKLFPHLTEPTIVKDFQVPVIVANVKNLVNESWDKTILKILEFVNGVYSVKRIAKVTKVDLNLVKEVIRHLIYYKIVELVDIFLFSNVYVLIGSLHELFEMQQECVEFVSIGDEAVEIMVLFRYYAALRHGITVTKWIKEQNINLRRVDVRKMMLFGVLKGFLRRLETFPMLPEDTRKRLPKDIARLVDGKHHFDEIATTLNIPIADLERIFVKDPEYRFYMK